jgi:hypothetical protein
MSFRLSRRAPVTRSGPSVDRLCYHFETTPQGDLGNICPYYMPDSINAWSLNLVTTSQIAAQGEICLLSANKNHNAGNSYYCTIADLPPIPSAQLIIRSL